MSVEREQLKDVGQGRIGGASRNALQERQRTGPSTRVLTTLDALQTDAISTTWEFVRGHKRSYRNNRKKNKRKKEDGKGIVHRKDEGLRTRTFFPCRRRVRSLECCKSWLVGRL